MTQARWLQPSPRFHKAAQRLKWSRTSLKCLDDGLPIFSCSAFTSAELVILFFADADLHDHRLDLRPATFHRSWDRAHAAPTEGVDYSIVSSIAVGIAYAYPYAQVIYLRWSPGHGAWPAAGLVLVTLAASLSLVSLLAIGRLFGVRPAVRGLVTSGPYRFVRHPMYLSYVLADIGYNPQEWNSVTLLLVFSRLGVSGLPHPRRGAGTLSTCRMASLRRLGPLPPFPRSLVKAPLVYLLVYRTGHLLLPTATEDRLSTGGISRPETTTPYLLRFV